MVMGATSSAIRPALTDTRDPTWRKRPESQRSGGRISLPAPIEPSSSSRIARRPAASAGFEELKRSSSLRARSASSAMRGSSAT
jgi:hypothetical protein